MAYFITGVSRYGVGGALSCQSCVGNCQTSKSSLRLTPFADAMLGLIVGVPLFAGMVFVSQFCAEVVLFAVSGVAGLAGVAALGFEAPPALFDAERRALCAARAMRATPFLALAFAFVAELTFARSCSALALAAARVFRSRSIWRVRSTMAASSSLRGSS